MEFSQELLSKIEEFKSRYPQGKQKSALIPLLHLVQKENENWLSAPVMDTVAQWLEIQPIEVYEVASFYSMFNLKPVGKNLIEVCRTGPCAAVGAEKIINHISQKLGIKDGETSKDGLFTLKTVECLGACGYGPMLQIGEKFYENLTNENLDQLLDNLKV